MSVQVQNFDSNAALNDFLGDLDPSQYLDLKMITLPVQPYIMAILVYNTEVVKPTQPDMVADPATVPVQ